MMKKIVFLTAMPLLMAVLASCSSKDEFTDSIFDTSVPAVDQTKSTAEFDQWLYDNFVVPYNVQVNYRFDQAAADKRFVLTPANYKRSQLLAHLIMYLYYDVYTKYAGEDFMKQYGPRIFQFIGSSGYSATQGTEVLGTASGGVKITLFNINEMKEWSEGTEYDGADVEVLNERFFHTMHHEFSHILHQTKSFPKEYELISAGLYDSQSWQYRSDAEAYSLGFVTPYSMSEAHEDFVEVISSYITDTRETWQKRGFTMSADHTHIEAIDEEQEGTDIIAYKINMCKDWLLEKYDYELDSLRAEVQRRQDALTYDIVMNDAYDK